METRIFWLKMLLAFASLIGTSHLADAQEKSPQKTKAPAPKSADHATTGDQNALGETNNPTHKQAVIWPGMTRAGATVLCPTAGHSNRPAVRRSWGICRSRSPCIRAEPILAILHAGYGEHEIVTVNGSTGKVIGRVALPRVLPA